jgi:tetratricopeptide (TPR) repeat protein
VTAGHSTRTVIHVAVFVVAAMAILAPARAQSADSVGTASVHGFVRDTTGKPVANAAVYLVTQTWQRSSTAHDQITRTDSDGHYRFPMLRSDTYSVRVRMTGYDEATAGPLNLAERESTKIDFTLVPGNASKLPTTPASEEATAKTLPQPPEFFDEPQFTVAGVTQAANAGGHGSDTVLRTTEALAKATLSLNKETGSAAEKPPAATETSLREATSRDPKNPDLHRQLGDVEEKLGNPLEAVREYQRAAELDPSEVNLFDWGTELLAHRALEPATEVFTKGNRLFPNSVRILIALGVASYARGSDDHATRYLVSAADLDPGNPTPYLFLGKMQSAQAIPSQESVERLARFAHLHPENAQANYYYATGLWKQLSVAGNAGSDSAHDRERTAQVEALLEKAVHLDPKLGAAYLQLGILYSQRGDFARAIPAYEKAIAVSSSPNDALEESHYRLAQAYSRIGNKSKAQEELQLHAELSKKTKEDDERRRGEAQEFVISLRNKKSESQ